MILFPKNHGCPIGADMEGNCIRLAQLDRSGRVVNLIAGGSETCPDTIKPESIEWQRWTIDTLRNITEDGEFQGADVITSMPASELFVDYLKLTKEKSKNVEKAVWSEIEHKLPYDVSKAVVKYIPTECNNLIVMATEKENVNRCLAIYENSNLNVKAIGVWPEALVTTYVNFFGRRRSDIDTVVMLIDIEAGHTNVVICRSSKLLFAYSVAVGTEHLGNTEMITKLMLELTGCKKQFGLMYENIHVERLIFLSGSQFADLEKDACTTIAEQLEMPAQLGDCFAAVEMHELHGLGIDRRGSCLSWATAFGLSLS